MTKIIEKEFRFDAGHRVLGSKYSKEETLHGHTYRLRISVGSDDELDSGKNMVFDANELGVAINPLIDKIDHSFLMWDADPIRDSMVALCKEANISDKLMIVNFNPTYEGMVEYFYQRFIELLPLAGCRITRIELDAATTLRAAYVP